MEKVSYKEKERQRREGEIIRAAAQLLTERGYANLNMDDLADVVGISKPTLYQHFKGKDELIVRVYIDDLRAMNEQLARTLQGTPIVQFQQVMRAIMKARHARGSVLAALDPEVVWKLFRTNDQIAKGREEFHEKLRQVVIEAQQLGEIDAALSPSIVVRSMFCLQGALSDPAMRAELASSEEKLDEAIDSVIRLFIRGITPEGSNPHVI
jgi:AcrR family transcriptional regulator